MSREYNNIVVINGKVYKKPKFNFERGVIKSYKGDWLPETSMKKINEAYNEYLENN